MRIRLVIMVWYCSQRFYSNRTIIAMVEGGILIRRSLVNVINSYKTIISIFYPLHLPNSQNFRSYNNSDNDRMVWTKGDNGN
uniref:Secreted protein n=1 Tax=Ascaris lumbricoides TaxID=6252 RepID=A0A0M3HH65_ASCLU